MDVTCYSQAVSRVECGYNRAWFRPRGGFLSADEPEGDDVPKVGDASEAHAEDPVELLPEDPEVEAVGRAARAPAASSPRSRPGGPSGAGRGRRGAPPRPPRRGPAHRGPRRLPQGQERERRFPRAHHAEPRAQVRPAPRAAAPEVHRHPRQPRPRARGGGDEPRREPADRGPHPRPHPAPADPAGGGAGAHPRPRPPLRPELQRSGHDPARGGPGPSPRGGQGAPARLSAQRPRGARLPGRHRRARRAGSRGGDPLQRPHRGRRDRRRRSPGPGGRARRGSGHRRHESTLEEIIAAPRPTSPPPPPRPTTTSIWRSRCSSRKRRSSRLSAEQSHHKRIRDASESAPSISRSTADPGPRLLRAHSEGSSMGRRNVHVAGEAVPFEPQPPLGRQR